MIRASQVSAQYCPACPTPQNQQLPEAITAQSQTPIQTASMSGTMTVDVAGAVKKPGLYTLHSPARVADAIAQAGGFSEVADATYVAQKLNLASQLHPDSKLYIPTQGESWSPPSTLSPSSDVDTNHTSPTININSASKNELMELPGIGAVTAEKIINNRPYGTINELIEREVITQTIYNKISTQVSAE